MTLPNQIQRLLNEMLEGISFKTPKCKAMVIAFLPQFVYSAYDREYIRHLQNRGLFQKKKYRSRDELMKGYFSCNEDLTIEILKRAIDQCSGVVCTFAEMEDNFNDLDFVPAITPPADIESPSYVEVFKNNYFWYFMTLVLALVLFAGGLASGLIEVSQVRELINLYLLGQ